MPPKSTFSDRPSVMRSPYSIGAYGPLAHPHLPTIFTPGVIATTGSRFRRPPDRFKVHLRTNRQSGLSRLVLSSNRASHSYQLTGFTAMTFPSFIARLAQALTKAVADYKANKPLPPAQPMTNAQMVAGAQKLQALLDEAIPILQAHPGAITAAVDILNVLDDAEFPWAVGVEEGVDAIPGALDMIRKWLPEAIWALGALQAAPTGITGDHPTDGGFIVGRG